jgi:hypothetical protein
MIAIPIDCAGFLGGFSERASGRVCEGGVWEVILGKDSGQTWTSVCGVKKGARFINGDFYEGCRISD